MSQVQTAPRAAATAPSQPRRSRQLRREDFSNLPTRKGREGAKAFFAEIGVHSITDSRLRHATESGELKRFKIASHNWYADADLFDFLMSLASGGRGGAA